MKEKEDLKKEIEAVLFAAGRKISTEEIAKLCKAEKKETEEALRDLKNDYEQKNSPLLLTEEADGYKLTVREKYLSIVKEITPHTELNRAMMETLAVIAWRQPVMQSDVIKIRTSNAYEDVRNLVEMGFISKEKHGRTFILKPTGKFFEYFDLPSKEAVKEVFKDVKDVEPETQEKLETEEEKLGKLGVYESAEKKEEKPEEDAEPKERLGRLEVFTEPEEEGGEEEAEEGAAEEGKEEAEEKGEETDEEKARELIHGLAEEGEEIEEGADKAAEEAEKQEPEEKTEEPEEKKRLPKELEEFAGTDEEEKKEEEDEEKEENE